MRSTTLKPEARFAAPMAFVRLTSQRGLKAALIHIEIQIEVIELEKDMVEVAMKNWSDWIYQINYPVSHTKSADQVDSVLVK